MGLNKGSFKGSLCHLLSPYSGLPKNPKNCLRSFHTIIQPAIIDNITSYCRVFQTHKNDQYGFHFNTSANTFPQCLQLKFSCRRFQPTDSRVFLFQGLQPNKNEIIKKSFSRRNLAKANTDRYSFNPSAEADGNWNQAKAIKEQDVLAIPKESCAFSLAASAAGR